MRVDSLTERPQLAMDNGARRVLLPSENKCAFADIPSDVLDRLQIIFYSDLINAAFRPLVILGLSRKTGPRFLQTRTSWIGPQAGA